MKKAVLEIMTDCGMVTVMGTSLMSKLKKIARKVNRIALDRPTKK